jgi:hypothetical protein
LFSIFDDPTGNPIAALEHDDGGLHREGNSHEEGDEKADRKKDVLETFSTTPGIPSMSYMKCSVGYDIATHD